MKMDRKTKKFWRVSIGEALAWLLPAFLAAIAHLFAFPKAELSGTGPGIHLLNMNEETITAQQAWHFANAPPYPLLLYALFLFAVFLLLQAKQVHVLYRIVVFILFAIPGLWYFNMELYLGGKLLGE